MASQDYYNQQGGYQQQNYAPGGGYPQQPQPVSSLSPLILTLGHSRSRAVTTFRTRPPQPALGRGRACTKIEVTHARGSRSQ